MSFSKYASNQMSMYTLVVLSQMSACHMGFLFDCIIYSALSGPADGPEDQVPPLVECLPKSNSRGNIRLPAVR